MVAVAHIMNATLVIPQLDKRSFWQDSRYSQVFSYQIKYSGFIFIFIIYPFSSIMGPTTVHFQISLMNSILSRPYKEMWMLSRSSQRSWSLSQGPGSILLPGLVWLTMKKWPICGRTTRYVNGWCLSILLYHAWWFRLWIYSFFL